MLSFIKQQTSYFWLVKVSRNDVTGRTLFFSLVYLYDEVWRRDVSRQGSEVDSSLLM